jgi:hypothetical protein
MKGVSNLGCENRVEKLVQITATGLTNLNNALGLEVFPNPNSGSFTIQFNSTELAEVILYNLHGQIMYQAKHNTQDFVQLNSIRSGVYLLKITQNNKVGFQKMVIE